MIKATFSPRSRNRYRCNQTGEVVGRGGVERIRRQYEGRERTVERTAVSVFSEKDLKTAMVIHVGWESVIFCPWCRAKNYVEPQDNRITCFSCDKRIKLKRDFI